MWLFVEYAAKIKPLIAVFESVRAAYTKGHPLMRDLRARLEARTGVTWTLYHVVHDAYALGGPAIRRRYFWVASRIPFGVEHPQLEFAPTLHDAIGDLEPLDLKMSSQAHVVPATRWSRYRRAANDAVDGHVVLDNPNARRLTDLATMVGWKPGRGIGDEARRCYETHGSLPESWRGVQDRIVAKNFDFGFGGTVRWPYDAPARVVTGAGPNIAVHPALDRTFTHREVARILGFPDDWLIEPLAGVSGLGMTWGKGITVDAGRWIATWVRESLSGSPGSMRGVEIGPRELEIVVSRPRVCGSVTESTAPMRVLLSVSAGSSEGKQNVTEAAEKPVEAPSDAATPAVEGKRRGRGRPTDTIERDSKVLAAITAEGVTREEIVTATGLDSTRVYQSLWRLRRDGAIERARDGRAHSWKLVQQA